MSLHYQNITNNSRIRLKMQQKCRRVSVACNVLLRAVYFSAAWGNVIYAYVPQSCVEAVDKI